MNQTRERVFNAHSKPAIHHVSLFVADLEASIDFYTNGLGLEVCKDFDDIVGVHSAQYFPFQLESVFLKGAGDAYIELHPAVGADMSPPGFPMNHIALGVANVNQAYDDALRAGGKPFTIDLPDRQWDGAPLDVVMSGVDDEPMRMAILVGPSQELIELYEAS